MQVREKDLALATCSHELRTPLNGILNMLTMIQANPQDRERYIKIAQLSAKLMLSLVNDMLDFSSILANKFVPKVRLFDLCEAVNEAADLLRFLIEEKGLQLSVRIANTLPRSIITDKDRLTQVILNLLSNAYKYTVEGSISLEIEAG